MPESWAVFGCPPSFFLVVSILAASLLPSFASELASMTLF